MGPRIVRGFVLDKWLYPVLELLAYYFAQDPYFEELGYDLRKGIMLFGPVGCGKTALFEVLSKLDPRFSCRTVDCDDVSRRYIQEGDAALDTYCTGGKLLLDDVGVDNTKARHYGNGANPVGDVIRRRYRLRERALTHGTTNCDLPTLEDLYKDRICDRMVEMFNFIEFDPETPSRRQVRPTPLLPDDVR